MQNPCRWEVLRLKPTAGKYEFKDKIAEPLVEAKQWIYIHIYLGGGFKYVVFSALFGEDSHVY